MEAVHAASGVYAYLLQFIAFVVCTQKRVEESNLYRRF